MRYPLLILCVFGFMLLYLLYIYYSQSVETDAQNEHIFGGKGGGTNVTASKHVSIISIYTVDYIQTLLITEAQRRPGW